MTNGSTLTESFSIKEQLAAVRLYVELNRKDDSGPFSLMTTFPRKVYQEDELGKTLEDLSKSFDVYNLRMNTRYVQEECESFG